MTGGLVQLVARGSQDAYLTSNPHITFFKTVYRRYTNFSVETIEHSFIGDIQFGKKVSVILSKGYDLINKMYVKIQLDAINTNHNYFAWTKRLGHAIIDNIEVVLGGTTIDRQYGVWLDIWYELARNGNQDNAYKHMIGDISILTDYNNLNKPSYT